VLSTSDYSGFSDRVYLEPRTSPANATTTTIAAVAAVAAIAAGATVEQMILLTVRLVVSSTYPSPYP